jgi:4-carboxymuconolactone decarboxylase
LAGIMPILVVTASEATLARLALVYRPGEWTRVEWPRPTRSPTNEKELTMSRLPVPSDSEEFSEGTREAVRHILKTRGGSIPAPSGLLTYAERAGALLSDLVEHLRYHTSLTNAQTELAICMSARASNNDYIWNAHTRLGLQEGTREEAIHAVDTHAPLDGLTEDEALIIQFGRELLQQPSVSDATFDAVRARFGERGLMELVAVMSAYTMNANILRVVDHQPAPGARLLTR